MGGNGAMIKKVLPKFEQLESALFVVHDKVGRLGQKVATTWFGFIIYPKNGLQAVLQPTMFEEDRPVISSDLR